MSAELLNLNQLVGLNSSEADDTDLSGGYWKSEMPW